MRKLRFPAGFCLFMLAISACLAADSAPSTAAAPVNPQEIIHKFSAKESAFSKARNNYTYRQTVKILELDADGNPEGGKYEMVEDVTFTPDGKRTERVVKAPPNTLKKILLTPEDEQDLRNVQPFVLNSETIDQYIVNYIGREQVDEIPCYLFAVRPKEMVKGQRYFEGQIWVDDRDLQIVKTYGKGVGRLKKSDDNQFPKFETYREQIDGKYWFPTYTIGNDTLHFKEGPQRIKMVVKYEDYKQFKADTTIQYGDEAPGTSTPGASTPPTQNAPPLAPPKK